MSKADPTPAELAAELAMVHCEAKINDGRAVSFSVNVDRNCSQRELDSQLDKMRLAIERQKKFSSIEAAILDIANLEAQIFTTGAEIETNDQVYAAKMNDGQPRKGDYHGMTKEQENMRKQQASRIEGMHQQVKMLRHRLDELRSEVCQEVIPMQQAAE